MNLSFGGVSPFVITIGSSRNHIQRIGAEGEVIHLHVLTAATDLLPIILIDKGDVPFSIRRLPDLAGTVLMNTAPLSKRFNFEGIVSLCAGAVNRISFTFLEFCTTCRRKNI